MHQLGEGAYQQQLRGELSGLQSLATSGKLKYIIINDDDSNDSNNGER